MKPRLSTWFDQYDGLWGVFTVKKTQLYTTFWLTGSCPYANIHIQRRVCVQGVPYVLWQASCFHANISTLSCSCTSLHTKRHFQSHFSSYGDVFEYSLTLSFPLLRLVRRNYLMSCSLQRRYSDVSTCNLWHTKTCLCALVWLDRHVCTQMFN